VVRTGTTWIMQTTANLNLRSAPSTSGKKLAVVPKGTRLTVPATKSGWSQVRHASQNGWVSGTYLRAIPKAVKRG
jgi:D-alanyl-D-alanine carboxypeptidase